MPEVKHISKQRITRNNYTLVHIRRGDKLGNPGYVCNTSVEAVSKVVRCKHALGVLGSGLLVMTNERDRAYLHRLNAVLTDIVGPLRVVVIEPLTLKIARSFGALPTLRNSDISGGSCRVISRDAL